MRLYEFGEYQPLPSHISLSSFKAYIKEVWNNRHQLYSIEDSLRFGKEKQDSKETRQGQALLRFDGNEVQARNYTGFIYYTNLHMEIYPKIFEQKNISSSLVWEHLLYYLSYCRSFRFPFTQNNGQKQLEGNILQVHIHWFALFAEKCLVEKPYLTYQEVSQSTHFVQGKLDVGNYIRTNISTGQWHEVYTRHTPFLYDNTFNQLVKYTLKEVISLSSPETRQVLQSLQFILQEVSDHYFSYTDCDRLAITNLDEDQLKLVEWCRFFLANKQVDPFEKNGTAYSFLVPMERVFEEFIAGFIEKHFPELHPQIQSGGYLAAIEDKKAFAMKNDIWLPGSATIIDTKYKILDSLSEESTYTILQEDLYQMVAYAIRRGSTKVHLFYPQTTLSESIKLAIKDSLANTTIYVHVHFLPIMIPDEKLVGEHSVEDKVTPLLKAKLKSILT